MKKSYDIELDYKDKNNNHAGLFIEKDKNQVTVLTPWKLEKFNNIHSACFNLEFYGYKLNSIYYE